MKVWRYPWWDSEVEVLVYAKGDKGISNSGTNTVVSGHGFTESPGREWSI